jgi:hypothetical protein
MRIRKMVWKIIEPPSKTLRHYRGSPLGAPNTVYTRWAYALALRDIVPFGRNVVYAGNVILEIIKKEIDTLSKL